MGKKTDKRDDLRLFYAEVQSSSTPWLDCLVLVIEASDEEEARKIATSTDSQHTRIDEFYEIRPTGSPGVVIKSAFIE